MSSFRDGAALLLATALISAAGAAEKVWFRQDFEDPRFSSAETAAEGASPEAGRWRGLAAPHAEIVPAGGGRSGNALKTTRHGGLRTFVFSGVKPLPAKRNYTFGFDVWLEPMRKTFCLLLDASGKRIAGFNVQAGSQLKLSNERLQWQSTGISLPSGWVRVEASFDVISSEYTVSVTGGGKSEQVSVPLAMLSSGTPARIEFGTSLPEGTWGVIDNIQVSYDPEIPTAGRTDAAAGASRSTEGEAVLFEFTSPAEVSSARISGAAASVSARGLNVMGQWQQLFANVSPDADGVVRVDFAPAKISQVEISGAPKLAKAEFFTAPGLSRSAADRKFQEQVYGEFYLPIYENDTLADLHIFNRTNAVIPAVVTLTGRKSGERAGTERKIELKPGENVIEFDTAKLAAGEYVAHVRDGGSGGAVRRLLRLQKLPVPRPQGVPDLRGERIVFADDYFFKEQSGLVFRAAVAKQHRVTRPFITPGHLVQTGDGVYIDGGKIVVPFHTNDNFFTAATRRNYVATASLDDLGHWSYREREPGEKLPRSTNVLAEPPAVASDWQPKPGPDGKINYRFYDPARDGKIDVRQVFFQYITFNPKEKLGGADVPDWGGYRPPQRTTWPIWHRAPGEALVLTRKPFLVDGLSLGEFESEQDTNDNFAGQWLSADGKTLYYARGRILRRYPPYNVPYDNGSRVVRIIHVFRTTDGINFERAAMALPDHADVPGTQHYGASVFRLREGAGLWAALVMRYFGRDQRVALELACSRDGFNWKRFQGPIFADNGPKGSWNAGYIAGAACTAVSGGRAFALITRTSSVYHFNSELVWNRRDLSTITGPMVQKYMAEREVDKWPLFKEFRDWDDLAAYIRDVTHDTGLLEFRENGLFYAEAGDAEANFATVPVRGAGTLRINAETTKDGFVEIELVSGCLKLGSKRVSGDLRDAELFSGLPDGEYEIRGKLRGAKLYTLGFFTK